MVSPVQHKRLLRPRTTVLANDPRRRRRATTVTAVVRVLTGDRQRAVAVVPRTLIQKYTITPTADRFQIALETNFETPPSECLYVTPSSPYALNRRPIAYSAPTDPPAE